MPRTRKGAGKGVSRQGVKSVEIDVKAARRQARELLKKAGKNLREFRKEVSELKKVGVLSPRVKASKQRPTRYMLGRLKRFADVIRGEVIPVPAAPEIRHRYRDKGVFEERGRFIMVPKESAGQTAQISRGMVEIVRPLKWGEERRIILPFKATDMEGVAHRLMDDPTLDGMKGSTELFGFRLFGHNMNTIGFPDAKELAQYILTNYAHLFSGKSGREAVKHFVLFRFKARNSQLSETDEADRIYTPRKGKPKDERGERDWMVKKRRERDAARKRKARDNETPEQTEKRRRYQRQYKQRKFEED
jgi:hypothetical protein